MRGAIITRAGGFIGRAVVKELAGNGVDVLALELPDYREDVPQHPRIRFQAFDLKNYQMLDCVIPPGEYDVMYHFAWRGSSGKKRGDVELQLENVKDTIRCIEIAKKLGVKRFIGAGSVMEKELYYLLEDEGSVPEEGHIYSMGKLAAHGMGQCTAAREGVDFIWASITNTYGPGENSPRFLNNTLRKIAAGEKLVFTEGTQNYDFVFIDDVARAFNLIGRWGKPYKEYIIGSGAPGPLRKFVQQIGSTLAPERELEFGTVPYIGASLPLSCFDITALKEDTGFVPRTSFVKGIQSTYKWIVEGGHHG